MGIRQNLTANLRILKEHQGQTLAEFSEEVWVSQSHLHELLKGRGNPRTDTIEHISRKLGMEPVELISNTPVNDGITLCLSSHQLQVIDLLLRNHEGARTLKDDERRNLATHILQAFQLWDEEAGIGKEKTATENSVQVLISAILKAVKRYRGQSMTKFAEEMGVSRSHLQKLLKREVHPRMGTIERIAEQLDIEPAALLSNCLSERQFQIIDDLIKHRVALDLENMGIINGCVLQTTLRWEVKP